MLMMKFTKRVTQLKNVNNMQITFFLRICIS